ncbi:hypothetical protein WA158_000459 [Blastocystis sp. Blastoise]
MEHLIIVIACDCYDSTNTGGVITAQRFTRILREQGHTVRIIAPGKPEKDKYLVPEFGRNNPLGKLCEQQGITLAKINRDSIREALTGADVLYTLIPTPMAYACIKIAKEMGVPVTTGFHTLPENCTYNVYLGWFKALNSFGYTLLKWLFYSKVNFIHCPTQFVCDQLEKHHYKANKYVFSNGTIPFFHPMEVERPEELKNKFVIISVGRLSNEKRQDILIKAVNRCKYKDDIAIILGGKGPNEKKYRNLAKKLPNPIHIEFYDQENLRKTLNMCDLYVHCADAEVESMSCTEAFSCGIVPLISDAKMSATKQFALTKNNIFKAGSSKDLAKHIEYWMDNREELSNLSKQYIDLSKSYSIYKCADKMVSMFHDAIEEKKNKVM